MGNMKEIFARICREIRTLDQALGAALAAFCGTISDQHMLLSGSYEEFVLRRALEDKERDLKYLQFQLAKVRADNTELRQLHSTLAAVFADVLSRSNEQLRRFPAHTVRETADRTGWEVVTAHCCLGGCDLDVYAFPTERDARLLSVLLTAMQYHAPNNRACPSCYAEYMKDCI